MGTQHGGIFDEDGAVLLDELHSALTRYVVFPSPEAVDAVTLFIAATHVQQAWEHATRLVIKSPIKRCGKTRLQEIIAETCHEPLRTANCSTAALVRSITDDDPPTLILDEYDTVFGGKKAAKDGVAEDLRGVINAGHSRGWPYTRWDPAARRLEKCPTFAMVVLGGIGDLPDTIEDRAVVISMRRRGNGEDVDPFRRRNAPALNMMRGRLRGWITPYRDKLAETEPSMPVRDRAADTWEPLVAVADLAGGSWPARARKACLSFTKGAGHDDASTAGERLLGDLVEVWRDEDVLFTTTILERLHKLAESPWSDWYGKPLTDRSLAGLLKPYGVKSKTVRIGEATAKGYTRAELSDPWGRYVTGVTASHDDENPPLTRENACDASVTEGDSGRVTASDLGKYRDCDAVTAVTEYLPETGRLGPCGRCGETRDNANAVYCSQCMADLRRTS